MLQLPNPDHCALEEGLLLHHTSLDCLVILAALELLVLNMNKMVVKVI